jgi:hypothetical protein
MGRCKGHHFFVFNSGRMTGDVLETRKHKWSAEKAGMVTTLCGGEGRHTHLKWQRETAAKGWMQPLKVCTTRAREVVG